MKIACILVHYHTPLLLKRAVSAIRADLSSSNLTAEIIVIDNGSNEEDRPLLEGMSVKIVDPGDNLGYAGGVNLGVKNTDADIFIFMNPDVQVLPGCIRYLVNALNDGASASGPRFYMDLGRQLLLQPLIDLTRRNEILWRMSALSDGIATRVRNSWRRHAKEHWLAESTILNYNLTGALLAIRRDAWEEVGPFDEVFNLYYEEADWLKRLKMKNLKAYYVPAAEALHQYNQSAAQEPRAKKWFRESGNTFRKRYYGLVFTAFFDHAVPMLRRLSNINEGNQDLMPETGHPSIDLSPYNPPSESPLWIEVSFNTLGIPAIGIPIYDKGLKKWDFPKANWDALEPGNYYFRIVDNTGKELDLSIFSRTDKNKQNEDSGDR